jgi:hypothetical protein
MCTGLEVTEEQTHEVGVHALLTADELVREGKAGHQAPLQQEDGRERAKEDTLDGSESDYPFSKRLTTGRRSSALPSRFCA